MIKRAQILLFTCFLCFSASGQQLTQYSQYLYNLFVINPAYSGAKDYGQVFVSDRLQWVGFDGAPHSQSLAFNMPLADRKMAIGANVINESIGARGVSYFAGTYSYSILGPASRLSFGIRAGAISYRFNADKVDYKDNGDASGMSQFENQILPSVDAGLDARFGNWHVGVVGSHLLESTIQSPVESIYSNDLKMHAFGYVARIMELGKNVKLRPSIAAKYVEGAPVNLDVNMSVLFKNTIHFGVTYRSSNTAAVMLEAFVIKNLRIGYSFDHSFSMLPNSSIVGSHEVFLGYIFARKSAPMLSPRYF